MRAFLILALLFLGCGGSLQPTNPGVTRGPVTAGRTACSDGPVRALTDAGDEALCLTPEVACDPTRDLLLEGQCHLPPSASAASACCDPRPAGCDPADCDCLLRNGPWIDSTLAADAGTRLVDYRGPKQICSYELSCIPATDGGVPVISCTPA